MLVTREFTFDAAHNLSHYKGREERLHGHTYRLQVTVRAPLQANGMAFDFLEMDTAVQADVLTHLNHAYLNDVVEQSSAEHVALWIWERLASKLPLYRVRLWELTDAFVDYYGPSGIPIGGAL
jgi:6-pyruvoyltetrahydropterin/6-carboxytetrahydropterin synthase